MITKGDLPLQIEWLMNGVPVQNEQFGINILQNAPRLSTLSIVSLEPKHRGWFECRATNMAGTASATAELLLNGYLNSITVYICFFVLYINHFLIHKHQSSSKFRRKSFHSDSVTNH